MLAAISLSILLVGKGFGHEAEAAALAGAIGLIGAFAIWAQSQSRRALDQWIGRHRNCPAFVSWDDSGFHTGGCMQGEDCSFRWESIQDVTESTDFPVLRTRQGPLFVPRYALDSDVNSDLQDHLDRHRVQRKSARNLQAPNIRW